MPDVPDKALSAKDRRVRVKAAGREYRLHRDERADEGVRRVARGRVDAAIEQLRRDSRADLATAVHDTRKDMKKLRAVVRLVRDGLGEERYRRENARYRDAARLLAGSRDAEVKLETLAGLRERYGDEVPTVAGLEGDLERERDRLAGDVDDAEIGQRLEQAAGAIEAGGATIAEWPLDASGWKLMRSGLERSYRRGRARFEAVRADPTPENVHEWRKRVKDLWYHLRLLHSVWPEAMKGPASAAHELSDLLGDHHDLTVLAEEIRVHANGDASAAALLELTERRQRELFDAAIPLGARLYAEKPKQFTTRLAVYWRAWQSDGG